MEFKQGIELEPDNKYDIQVKKTGYVTYQKWIRMGNEDKTITVQLVPKKYRLYLDTTPQNAQVKFLNLNQDFQQGMELKSGRYPLEISSPGYETSQPVVEIKNEDVHQGFELKPHQTACTPVATHTLSLRIMPSNTQITIPNLRKGQHELEISRPGYHTKKVLVAITDQDVTEQVNFSAPVKNCQMTKNGDNKITVSINRRHTLRFVKIDSGNIDNIALTEEQAQKFHEAAQQMAGSSSPFPPFIFRAVSEQKMPKVVPAFWIQANTISSQLFQTIIQTGSVDKVSYKQAQKVIETLNEWCQGKAKFELPVEKQLVYLAKQIYDPVGNKGELKPCRELKDSATPKGVKQLLGNNWQLTQSKCDQFDMSSGDATRECDDRMYVTKGGTTDSKNATECMPEYRGTSSPNVETPNTTFRLVLD